MNDKLEHNGWTNVHTWAAHLLLSNNDPWTYQTMCNAAKRGFESFKVIAKHRVERFKYIDSIELSEVNWKEIYESFK